MILNPTLKTYRIAYEEVAKFAQIEININYQDHVIQQYFKEEFDLFYEIGFEPYQFGKHTFKDIYMLQESFRINVLHKDNTILKILKTCYFKKIELLVVKIGKQEIPVLRLIILTECDEELNSYLYNSLLTVLSIDIYNNQKNIGDIVKEKNNETRI